MNVFLTILALMLNPFLDSAKLRNCVKIAKNAFNEYVEFTCKSMFFYLGPAVVSVGKQLTFLYTSHYEHEQYNV